MVVGEGGADAFADLESAIISVKFNLGRGEGVVFGELEEAVVESFLVLFFETVEAEMKVEEVGPVH